MVEIPGPLIEQPVPKDLSKFEENVNKSWEKTI